MTATAPSRSPLPLPDADRALLPFLPLLYVAWADGNLESGEIKLAQSKLGVIPGMTVEQRTTLERWLDPAAPPSATDLQNLLALIRRLARERRSSAQHSLAALGQDLAGEDHGPAVAQALAELESAIGVVGREASRGLLAIDLPPEPVSKKTAAFDVAALTAWFDRDYPEVRAKIRQRLREPIFRYRYGLSKEDYREVVFDWVKELARDGYGAIGFPKQYGGGGDMGAFIGAFETLALHDHSLVIKYGVQFGLFGGSIFQLGTARHHAKYLKDVGTAALPGCFAMTELGHGSNVRDLKTLARYDQAKGEFVIHTPDDGARKEWIGGAARHARMATVFTQLEVDGKGYGVHAILVPIRDAAGKPMPGVRIADCGEKEGLNGVDNGRLWFDNVRVPRENLLNRFADVTERGEYVSPIASPSRRFFTMLGTLVAGRVSLGCAAHSAAKTALTVAIRYGEARRQFGPDGAPEMRVLDYRTHQLRLFPALATTYAIDAAMKLLVQRYVKRTDDDREVETLAAALKAFSSWHTIEVLQLARECCGGQGILTLNRIGPLRADLDVYTTFEGDNTVLMQLVAKGLLTAYKQQFGELKFSGVLKFLGKGAANALVSLDPITPRLTEQAHLRDPEFHRAAFRYREDRLLASAVRRLKQGLDAGKDSFDALNDVQDHLVTLAEAHAERVVLEAFTEARKGVKDAGVRSQLDRMATLYAVSRLVRHDGWYLACGYFEGNKARALRVLQGVLCTEVRPHAVALVDAFGIPDEVLAAPIAFSPLPPSL
ncbi:MAG: acyl-CoA dehydrogenase [Gemmatimonadales bacterium]